MGTLGGKGLKNVVVAKIIFPTTYFSMEDTVNQFIRVLNFNR